MVSVPYWPPSSLLSCTLIRPIQATLTLQGPRFGSGKAEGLRVGSGLRVLHMESAELMHRREVAPNLSENRRRLRLGEFRRALNPKPPEALN